MSMGVYIKGMEMPTSCDMCWALDDYGDYPRCRITEEQRGYNFPIREKRMVNCPLVPVPKHGWLIDADALRQSIKESIDECHKWDNELEDAIDYAPTIIPADEPFGKSEQLNV
jgi:hypothetical protein